MNLGFIGTGKIASSVIKGICKSSIRYNKIIISYRNKKISKNLKKRFKKISIEKNNQTIIDRSDWIFLAITPTVGKKILKDLKFKSRHTIISFISTITLPELKKITKIKKNIIRAIPLPPIALKKGPVPIYPPHKKVKSFFDKSRRVIRYKLMTCISITRNSKIIMRECIMHSTLPSIKIRLYFIRWIKISENLFAITKKIFI